MQVQPRVWAQGFCLGQRRRALGQLVALSLLLAGMARAGGIVYPALGHFHPDEGTLEIWFTPMQTELYPELPPGQYRGGFQLFGMQVPDHFNMRAGWQGKGATHGIGNSISHAGGDRKALLPLQVGLPDWQPGEPQHLAFTWKGNTMRLISGTHSGGREQAKTFTGQMGGQSLTIGAPDARDTLIIIQAVRFSRIARSAEALRAAQPETDLYTLMLDRFDAPECVTAEGWTRPVAFSRLSGAPGGQIKGVGRWVAEPVPGLALYR
ncbi:MAG: hypothetical protein K9N49_03570 [Candidatus Marinimicrobia bacterium]|nr:hypothetical protein [Candidatus Neomarinimicrobiota bacterium]